MKEQEVGALLILLKLEWPGCEEDLPPRQTALPPCHPLPRVLAPISILQASDNSRFVELGFFPILSQETLDLSRSFANPIARGDCRSPFFTSLFFVLAQDSAVPVPLLILPVLVLSGSPSLSEILPLLRLIAPYYTSGLTLSVGRPVHGPRP